MMKMEKKHILKQHLETNYIKIAKQEIELLGEILKLQEELKKAPVVTKSEEPIESSL